MQLSIGSLRLTLDLSTEDPVEESERSLLTFDLDEDATFEDLKERIYDDESFEPEEQQLYLGLLPLESSQLVNDVCSSGDTVSVHIWRQDALENTAFTMRSEDTITMIIGSREKFDRIPIKKNRDFQLQGNFASNGIIHTRVKAGWRPSL